MVGISSLRYHQLFSRRRCSRGMGFVSEVFNESKIKKLAGSTAICHVRYATAGASVFKNVQPFVAGYRFCSLAVARNRNLVNYSELRTKLTICRSRPFVYLAYIQYCNYMLKHVLTSTLKVNPSLTTSTLSNQRSIVCK